MAFWGLKPLSLKRSRRRQPDLLHAKLSFNYRLRCSRLVLGACRPQVVVMEGGLARRSGEATEGAAASRGPRLCATPPMHHAS